MTTSSEERPQRIAHIGSGERTITCGSRQPMLLIAGPCVIQDESLTLSIASRLKAIGDSISSDLLRLVFKASFDKANRTSVTSFRGPGIDEGLRILERVANEFDVVVTTDIHEPVQAAAAADVCELLQIPAFLARQTDLLGAAAKTGRAVNVKKGQFMAPGDMRHVVSKLREFGCQNCLLTERGTFFGYGRLVNDFAGLVEMRENGAPVVFDATHSVQRPGGADGITGGNRDMVAPLAQAAVAVGIDGLFLETHPNPENSPSDAANIYPLEQLPELLETILAIRQAIEPRR